VERGREGRKGRRRRRKRVENSATIAASHRTNLLAEPAMESLRSQRDDLQSTATIEAGTAITRQE